MTPETRAAVLTLAEERARWIETLRTNPSGLAWCARHTELCDRVVQLLCQEDFESHADLPPIAVIATGGYGRRELSPHSDIDITVLPSDDSSPGLDATVRALFQDLHWAFGTVLRMNVGYAYRLIGDAPGLDPKTRTGLLDLRVVWGSPDLARELEEACRDSFAAGEFILAKIREREAAMAQHNDTPLVVEPQIKEGAGGQRCFHCANWIREAIGEQPARPSPSFDLITRTRNLLHLAAGRHQDLLSRAKQAEIADQLGLSVYTMMSGVAKAASDLHTDFLLARERIGEARFVLSPGVVSVAGEARPLGMVDAGEAAVGVAVATQLGLKVPRLPFVATPTVQGPAATFALSAGEPTLRNLERCGLLAQLLPELESCRTLMPRDTVHCFTVHEHTMRVIRWLDAIPPTGFQADVLSSLHDHEPMYLAALLHDVGKTDESVEHSLSGEAIAQEVCERWRLNESIAADIVWLVRHHLEMARVIRIQDLQEPRTVLDFAELVGNVDRLGMLTLLTWADVNAVAEGAWTPAQETFLRELYGRTYAALQGDVEVRPDLAQTRQRLLRQLKGTESEEALRQFVESLPAQYMTSTPIEIVPLHMQMVRRAAASEPTVELFHRADIGATELTVCVLDEPGLLSQLLAVFYAFDLSLTGIRAATTTTEPKVALDVFTLSFSGRPVPAATANQVARKIHDVVSHQTEAATVMREKGKDPLRQQQIFQYSYRPGLPGILEVRAPRGRGMPYRFSRLLADQGWNILSARVGQWAGNGAAAFYIVQADGGPIAKEQVDAALRPLSENR